MKENLVSEERHLRPLAGGSARAKEEVMWTPQQWACFAREQQRMWRSEKPQSTLKFVMTVETRKMTWFLRDML